MEIIEGKIYINGLEKSPSVCSKAKYALGLKKVKPQNVKTCSKEYWVEVVTAFGKYNKVPKDKIEKPKASRMHTK